MTTLRITIDENQHKYAYYKLLQLLEENPEIEYIEQKKEPINTPFIFTSETGITCTNTELK